MLFQPKPPPRGLRGKKGKWGGFDERLGEFRGDTEKQKPFAKGGTRITQLRLSENMERGSIEYTWGARRKKKGGMLKGGEKSQGRKKKKKIESGVSSDIGNLGR